MVASLEALCNWSRVHCTIPSWSRYFIGWKSEICNV